MQLHHRHLDEAEFLLGVFDAALDAPHYELEALARGPERRLWAHLDALLVAGPQLCERLLLPIVGDPEAEPRRVAAASLALSELALVRARGPDPLASAGLRAGGTVAGPEPIWAQLLALHDACESPQLRAAIIEGLRLSSTEGLEAWLPAQIPGARGVALAARIELLRDRHRVPASLAEHLLDEDPAVARAAARAASLSRDTAHLSSLSRLGSAPHPGVREAAIESALHHYMPGSWAAAQYWALTPEDSPFRARALLWLALLGDRQIHAQLIEALDGAAATQAGRADLLWALSFCGRVAAVDAAMAWLEDEQLGPLAGELVTAIAGLSRDEPGCWRPRAEAEEDQALPALAEDRLDAELVPEATDALPRPEPNALRSWWSARRRDLDPKLRHLGGRPSTPPALVEALRAGPMRRRHAHALELAIRTGGQIQLRTRQTTARQRAELARLPELELLDLQRGLRRG